MFINVLKTDLKKSLGSISFVLSGVVMLILIFNTSCVVWDSGLPDYSIWEFILKETRETYLTSECYSWISIFSDGFSNQWLGVFIPFLCGFSCIPIFCDEYNSGNWRLCISRVGGKRYIFSKILCVIIISVLLIFICFGIFAVVCVSVFPSPDSYDVHRQWYDYYGFNVLFKSKSIALFLFGRLFTASTVAVVGGMFCLLVSAVSENKYASLGIPVLTYFFFAQVAKPKLYTGKESDLKWVLLDVSQQFQGAETLFEKYVGRPLYLYYVIMGAILLAMITAYFFIMKRRCRE